MTKIAFVCTAVLFANAACGGDANGTTLMDAAGPAISSGDGETTVTDASESAALPDAGSQTAPEASVPTPAEDAASAAPADASSNAPEQDSSTRPPLVLEIPVASVPCGDSTCETLNNVCCGSWSRDTGFDSELSCIPLTDCNDQHSRAGDQDRAIPIECDGKEDCSGGQVCCMYANGMPLCELDDVADCISKVYGPGGSGICADNDKCELGSTQFIASGVPLGVLACNDDTDCEDRPMTTCQPEEDDSLTTGKGVTARSYVKVCR